MARLKNTLVFSRKAYQEDEEFAKVVLETSKIAVSAVNHLRLIQERYPSYIVVPLFTFEHGSVLEIQTEKRCNFDSSADAFGAFKKEKDLFDKLLEINNDLAYEDYDDRCGYGYSSDEE